MKKNQPAGRGTPVSLAVRTALVVMSGAGCNDQHRYQPCRAQLSPLISRPNPLPQPRRWFRHPRRRICRPRYRAQQLRPLCRQPRQPGTLNPGGASRVAAPCAAGSATRRDHKVHAPGAPTLTASVITGQPANKSPPGMHNATKNKPWSRLARSADSTPKATTSANRTPMDHSWSKGSPSPWWSRTESAPPGCGRHIRRLIPHKSSVSQRL